MSKKIILVATLMALSTSCVTKKVYQDLENKLIMQPIPLVG